MKGMDAKKSLPLVLRRYSSRGQVQMLAEEDEEVSRNHTGKDILFWFYSPDETQSILLRGD